MTKPQEFEISVRSEDPKKKEKPEEGEKDKEEGSSKLLKDAVKPKDGKEDEGEDLVSYLSDITSPCLSNADAVRRRSPAPK